MIIWIYFELDWGLGKVSFEFWMKIEDFSRLRVENKNTGFFLESWTTVIKTKEIAFVNKASPVFIQIDPMGWNHLSSSWAVPSIDKYLVDWQQWIETNHRFVVVQTKKWLQIV